MLFINMAYYNQQLKDKDEGASKEYFIGFLLILN